MIYQTKIFFCSSCAIALPQLNICLRREVLPYECDDGNLSALSINVRHFLINGSGPWLARMACALDEVLGKIIDEISVRDLWYEIRTVAFCCA